MIPAEERRAAVDRLNAKFYGRFTYPWPPRVIRQVLDSTFERLMLSQSLGCWDRVIFGPGARIWVAGCGTNQAVLTALRFPDAEVVGTDVSAPSLAAAGELAGRTGVENLSLIEQPIAHCGYSREMDYVICTGVIHHTSDPEETLRRLARAIAPTGILELMVYNYYHMIPALAFQEAIHLLEPEQEDFDRQLNLAKALLAVNDIRDRLRLVGIDVDLDEAAFADALIQPVARSYTVDRLVEAAARAGLRLVAPVITSFDLGRGTFSWNLPIHDPHVRARYARLSDSTRWTITNHMLLERSPMLWFFLQREDAPSRLPDEHAASEAFLEHVFCPVRTRQRTFVRTQDGDYAEALVAAIPGEHPDDVCRRIVESVVRRPDATMRGILKEAGEPLDFTSVNRIRILLTTPSFPYLAARAA